MNQQSQTQRVQTLVIGGGQAGLSIGHHLRRQFGRRARLDLILDLIHRNDTHSVSKRVRVLLPDRELAEIQRLARRERLEVGEWVRRALRDARSRQPVNDSEVKLKFIRRAAEYSFPTSDME